MRTGLYTQAGPYAKEKYQGSKKIWQVQLFRSHYPLQTDEGLINVCHKYDQILRLLCLSPVERKERPGPFGCYVLTQELKGFGQNGIMGFAE